MPAVPAPTATDDEPAARGSAALLVVLSLAAFLVNLDLFIVNVAFPSIERDFGGASLSTLSWVLNGYAIVFAALLVPAGRLADIYGRRAGFLVGVMLFALGSALCTVAWNPAALITARVVEAAGGRDRDLRGGGRARCWLRAGGRRSADPGELAPGLRGQPAGLRGGDGGRTARRAGEPGRG